MEHVSKTICHDEVLYCTTSKLGVDAILCKSTVAQRGVILENGIALEEGIVMTKQNTLNVFLTAVIHLNWAELYYNK